MLNYFSGLNKPRNSNNHGWFLVWKSVSNLLEGTPFNRMVHPKRHQPVFVALEHQIVGGKTERDREYKRI